MLSMPGPCCSSSVEKGRLMRQEPGPALDQDAMRRVERLPLGADRMAPKLHADLLRRSVSLKGIASDAGGDAVGPVRHTPLRAGHDVVDRDRLGAGLRSAVLAGVMVPLGDIPPAERHRRPRQAVVVRKADDLGKPEAPVGRPHAWAAVQRRELGPGGPVVEPVLLPARRPSPSRSRA